MSDKLPGTEPLQENEKDVLTERAKALGIKNAHTMGVDTLKAKIAEKTQGKKTQKDAPGAERSERAKRIEKVQNARKLKRVILRNLNPAKNNHTYQLLKVSNKVFGTIHRTVPLQSDDEGTHVEQALLNTMREQEYLAKITRKHPKTGEMHTVTLLKKEWHITELPPLTEDELKELARKQELRDQAEAQ